MLSALAVAAGRTARVALRVNPDIDAGTNDKIATGRATDKFGIPYADAVALYARAASMPDIRPVGLATHIGSQILGLAPYRGAFAPDRRSCGALRRTGTCVETVDCGGGLGIPYRNEPAPFPRSRRRDEGGVPQPRCPPRDGTGPVAGRARRHAARLGRTGEADAAGAVRRPRCGDERPGSPVMYDAWHGIVPVSASMPLPPRARAPLSARSAKAATRSRETGRCRRWRLMRAWQSSTRALMVRL